MWKFGAMHRLIYVTFPSSEKEYAYLFLDLRSERDDKDFEPGSIIHPDHMRAVEVRRIASVSDIPSIVTKQIVVNNEAIFVESLKVKHVGI